MPVIHFYFHSNIFYLFVFSYIYNPTDKMGVHGEFMDLINPDMSVHWPWKIDGIHNWPKKIRNKPKWAEYGIRPYPHTQIGFHHDSPQLVELTGSDWDADGEPDIAGEGETMEFEQVGGPSGVGVERQGGVENIVGEQLEMEVSMVGEQEQAGNVGDHRQAEQMGEEEGSDMDLETASNS